MNETPVRWTLQLQLQSVCCRYITCVSFRRVVSIRIPCELHPLADYLRGFGMLPAVLRATVSCISDPHVASDYAKRYRQPHMVLADLRLLSSHECQKESVFSTVIPMVSLPGRLHPESWRVRLLLLPGAGSAYFRNDRTPTNESAASGARNVLCSSKVSRHTYEAPYH